MPEPNSGCWLWVGATISTGYGHFKSGEKMQLSHRLTYRAFKGEIPAGLEIDHKCRTHACCNPDHLEAVTHLENMRRGFMAQKKVCKNGHPYTEENTYRYSNGHRRCRACSEIWIRNRPERRHRFAQ